MESPLESKEIKPVNFKENHHLIFIGSPEVGAKAPILWLPDAKRLEKTLMLGKTEGRRRRGGQRMRWLDDIIGSVDMNLSKF